MGLCAESGLCRDHCTLHSPFIRPDRNCLRGTGTSPQGDPFGDPAAALAGKSNRAGRELPEEEAGCLIGCQAAFFRPCSPKKRKNFQKHKTGGQPSRHSIPESPEKTKRRDEHETKTAGTDPGPGHGPGPDRLRRAGTPPVQDDDTAPEDQPEATVQVQEPEAPTANYTVVESQPYSEGLAWVVYRDEGGTTYTGAMDKEGKVRFCIQGEAVSDHPL